MTRFESQLLPCHFSLLLTTLDAIASYSTVFALKTSTLRQTGVSEDRQQQNQKKTYTYSTLYVFKASVRAVRHNHMVQVRAAANNYFQY